MNKITDGLPPPKGGLPPRPAGQPRGADPPAWIVADLEKSDITAAIAAAARLDWTDSRERIAKVLNRRSPLPGGTCILFPYFDASGQPLDYCRLKPERPRTGTRDGKDRP